MQAEMMSLNSDRATSPDALRKNLIEAWIQHVNDERRSREPATAAMRAGKTKKDKNDAIDRMELLAHAEERRRSSMVLASAMKDFNHDCERNGEHWCRIDPEKLPKFPGESR